MADARRTRKELITELKSLRRRVARSKEFGDVSGHASAGTAHRVAEDRFIKAFYASPDAIVISDPSTGRILEVNPAFAQIFGYSPRAAIGRTTLELGLFKNVDDRTRALEQLRTGGRIRNFEVVFVAKGGREGICQLSGFPLDVDGRACVLTVVRDISAQRKLQLEVLAIGARERERIGRDLHDGLGQHITSLGFLARALERKLQARGLPEAADARLLQERIADAQNQTRFLSQGLLAVNLDSNLASAFGELAATGHNLYHMSCTAHVDPSLRIRDRDVAVHLYQIAREALTNAARHANAKHVVIRLGQTRRTIRLVVRDDGRGVPRGAASVEGLGQRIMRDRARVIGGALIIERGRAGGTVVRCTTPRDGPPG